MVFNLQMLCDLEYLKETKIKQMRNMNGLGAGLVSFNFVLAEFLTTDILNKMHVHHHYPIILLSIAMVSLYLLYFR